jgi:Na+-translocating ferredoxin:NAD+ oxidoreductase RnfA subunit
MQPVLTSLTNLIVSHKRLLSAIWFATLALLCVAVMFHRLTMSFRGFFLYVFLPIIAAGIAGSLWGVPILNRAKTNTLGQSLLRGIAVAAGAFVIFSLMFALAVPFIERAWSMRQSEGLFLFTWTLGLLLAAPIVLVGGMLAGATLYLFHRKALGD